MNTSFDEQCREWFEKHKYMTWRAIADEYGTTREVVRKRTQTWMRNNGYAVREDEQPNNEHPAVQLIFDEEKPVTVSGVEVKGDILFEDKKPLPTDDDVQALLDAYLNLQDKAKKLNTQQYEATVQLGNGLPCAIVYLGDPHLGSWGWAARRQLEDIKIIAETDGLYDITMGDEWDNFIFGFGKWASMMSPEHQRKIGHYVYKKLVEKTVATVGGNHLLWTEKAAGIDLNAELAEKMKAVFLGSRGDLNVKVGGEKYHLHLHHKARGRSSVNKTNSARVASNEIGGADVIVEADAHEPWHETTYQARKRQEWLRTGTYKLSDAYTNDLDFEQGKADMPMTIFLPDQHKVISYLNFHDGLLHLKALREEYRKREARGA